MRVIAAACALLSLALVRPSPQPQAAPTVHRHFDPQDRESGRYQYVPIDVAAGTEALTISYRYSGDDGTNVIDLGLFEPGSLALGTSSFRGYSGGARRTITVGRTAASPGYRAGPLPSGEWHVLLGLYKVAPGGVNVDIDVTESREPGAGDERTSRAVHARPDTAPPRTGPLWYSGALHLHTTHSDGSIVPGAVADAAQAAGLDFIVITDHNNTTHTREAMPAAPLHIVGEEVTTPGGARQRLGIAAGRMD